MPGKQKTKHRRADGEPITMEVIAAKCDEVGECLIWNGGRNSAGAPTMSLEKNKPVNVRRWIAKNVLGFDVDGLFVTPSCMDKACVAPDHVKVVTRQQLQKMWHDHLQYGQDLARRAKLSSKARQRAVHSPELIEKIRQAEGLQKDIAAELGVSKQLVSRVKRRIMWQEFTNNPWLGLLPGGRSRS